MHSLLSQRGPRSHGSRHRLALCALVLCLGSFGAAHAGFSAADADAQRGSAAFSTDTDRLIIKYRDASVQKQVGAQMVAQPQAVAAAALQSRVNSLKQIASQGGVQLDLLRQTGAGSHVMKLNRAITLAEAQALVARLKASDSNIEYAEPDRKMYALFSPNDSMYSQQWDLFETTGGIRAPAAWDMTTGSGVVVAVLDTGIRPHADLAGQTVAGYDMILDVATANDGNGRDGDPSDPGDWSTAGQCGAGQPARSSSWHGTHVAGTIAAKTSNSTGVAGIAFGAKVQAVRVLGRCGGYTSDIADGIIWASGGSVPGVPANATPAKVMNLSLGGQGACDTTTQNAVNGARARGSVVVVAAGNSNANASGFSPASCAGVISVAATDRYGARAPYSNYGASVSLAAPGGNTAAGTSNGILSTLNAGASSPGADNYVFYQGTSMAAPHVAGVAALMFSVKPTATPDAIAAALTSSARAFPGTCSQCGTGILNAQAAVAAMLDEVEPNGTTAQANLVSAPGTKRGVLSTTTDTDYYRVTLPVGKTLTATLPMPNSLIDYDLTLRNAAGAIVGLSENDVGVTDKLVYANTTGAAITLYVQVRYYSGNTNVIYSLSFGW